jgi:hypothetical protein
MGGGVFGVVDEYVLMAHAAAHVFDFNAVPRHRGPGSR